MKRSIIQTRNFSKEVDRLMRKRVLLKEDFDSFQRDLAENPNLGVVIPGTGGVRKIRLKASSRGKRGGFRVCYYYFTCKERLYLLIIYSKNEQVNLTAHEKNTLKELTTFFKQSATKDNERI